MLKVYASYFVAYLLNNLKGKGNIERIVLFGSVARGDYEKGSDVDLFVEIKKKSKKFENELGEVLEKFYQSREASLFKLEGVDNEFSIKIGILKEWKDLQKSIASTGVILYGPYEVKEESSGMEHHVIIYWDKIGKNRGAFLNKLYGFKVKGKRYEGILERYEGKKLGKSCVILPVQYKKEVFELLGKYKVEAKVLEIFK
jgi:predicted nucleotidyltransferase